ncbi:MAG: M23 family metallopeptidase [Candidatus Aminicenantes bacterium]|nr:M23 family metallopeptidase [Candidatus Aminicenantes bacterium]
MEEPAHERPELRSSSPTYPQKKGMNGMTKFFSLAAVFLALISSSGGAEKTVVRFTSGAAVELSSTALEPGGILLVKWGPATGVKKMVVRFGETAYESRIEQGKTQAFALVGLDLALEPGPHDLRMTVFLQDGRIEEMKHTLVLKDREFAVRNLRVKQEFVTPPPEVRERIRRESDLLQMVYSVSREHWLGEASFDWPHQGKNAGNFGERRVYNGIPRSSHSGLDIAAAHGSPVCASNSGRVVLARDLYFSGNTVILDHGLGVFTIYCHFSRLLVHRGQTVKRGDILALAGSTGRSTGPHLHWGVRIRGSRVDPEALLGLNLPE